jgi:hypothetical protein
MTARLAFLVLLLVLPRVGSAQNPDALVPALIARVNAGEAAAVREELPPLLVKHPNHPGLLFVQGLVTTNGAEAVRVYQSIVDNYPKSAWADDALFKVYQFYYALGLYRTADLKLAQLRRDYPASPFLRTAMRDSSAATVMQQEEPQRPESTPPQAGTTAELYTLQTGAFGTRANADRQRAALEGQGIGAEVVTRVRGGQTVFLVLHGTFATADEARARGAEILKTYNIPSFVVTR